jgi:hypothetical protein
MVSDNVIEQNQREESQTTILDTLEFGEEDRDAPVVTPEEPTETMSTRDTSLLDNLTFEPAEENANAVQGIAIDNMEPTAKAEIEHEADQIRVLAESLYDEEQIQAIKDKGPIGFWEAKDFLDYEDVAPGGGVFKAIDAGVLLKAADNIKNGKELSITQQETMNQFVKERVEVGLRTMSTGGSIASGLMQMPAFMVEFVASGGAGKVAQVAATKGAVKKAQAAAVGVLTTSLAPAMLPRYVGSVGERRVNQSMALTDKGDLIAKESVESPAKTALMALGHHTIEVGSEMAGGALAEGAKFVLKPVTKAISPIIANTVKPVLKSSVMSGLNKLPAGARSALFRAAKETNPNATVGRVFSQAGWNGLLEEVGEERLAQVLSGTLDLVADDNVTMENYLETVTPDMNQLMVEAGIISIMGGTKASSNIVVNLLETKLGSKEAATQAVNNMTVSEQEALITKEVAPRPDPDADVVDTEPQVDFTESSWVSIKNRLKETGADVYVAMFNDIQAIEDISAEATKAGNVVNPSLNLANTARRLRANSKLMEQNLINGTTRTNPETGQVDQTGVGYRQVLEGWDSVAIGVEPNVDVRAQDFNDYRAALSTLDDVQLEGIDISPEAQAKAEGDVARLQEKYGTEAEWLDVMAKESTEYTQRVLVNLVDAGVLSQEAYDDMITNRPNYTVMQRVLEEEVMKSTGKSVAQFSDIKSTPKALKKRKGSDKEVADINDNIMQYTADVIKLAETAKLGQQMAAIADYLPERVQKVAGTPGPFEAKDQIPYWENGELKWLQVDQPLVNAFKHLERTVPKGATMKFLDAIFRLPSSALRTGATITPEFAIRNFLRDTHSSFINSGGKLTPIDVIGGLVTQLTDKETMEQYYRDGAGFNSVRFGTNIETEKVYRQMLDTNGHGDKLAKYLNPFFTMNKVNELFEGAPRVGLYKKLKADNMTGIEAALAARDITLDFQRGGSTGRFLNRYIPFFNASLQGIDKTARVFRDNPKEAAMWASLTLTMPQMLLTGYYLYGADEETRQKYLELSDYQRDLGWPIMVDGEMYLYPKPFTVGYLFASLPERAMIAAATNEDDAEMQDFWKTTFGGTISATSPVTSVAGTLPVVAKLFTELTSNYSFFYDAPIVPDYKVSGNSAVEEADQFNRSTSETSKLAGGLFNVSPAKLDYTVSSLTGGLGKDYLLPLSDAFVRRFEKSMGKEVNDPLRTKDDIPVVRAFAIKEPVGPRSRSVNNFYNNLEAASKAYNSYDQRLETNDDPDGFYEKKSGLIEARKPMMKFYKDLRELNKVAAQIKEAPYENSKDQLEDLLEVEREITDVAKEANKIFREIKKD